MRQPERVGQNSIRRLGQARIPIGSAEGCTPRRALMCKFGGQRDGGLVSRIHLANAESRPERFAESERMNDRDYAALRT